MKKLPLVLLSLLSLLLAQTPVQALAGPPLEPPPCTTARPPASPGNAPGATLCTSITYNQALGTVSIAVSWLSRDPVGGSVSVLGVGSFADSRGASFSGVTHFVELRGLAPDSAFQFDVVSGGTSYDNAGQHWSIQTGPAMAPDPRSAILGRIQNAGGSDAGEALVYVTVERSGDGAQSALLSTYVTPNEGGYFSIRLGNARTALNGPLFSFDPTRDRVTVTANGGVGYAYMTLPIASALPPQPNPPNLTLTLGEGYTPAVTATPTATAPTATVVTATATVTPSATPSLSAATVTPTPRPHVTATFTAEPILTETPTLSPTELPTLGATEEPTRLADGSEGAGPGASEAPTSFRPASRATPAASGSAVAGLKLENWIWLVAAAGLAAALILAAGALILLRR